jgi:large subunit ribosomal protein L11
MAKKVIGNLKLRIPGGRATAGPPVGSTLGQWGLNMMDFINPFNDATKEYNGKDVIVHLKVYEDRKITRKQLEEIAEAKMGVLNANDIDAAVKVVAGSARSMGVTVED